MEPEKKNVEQEIELAFYSTKVCWSCHYDLEKNLPDSWWERTGCPNCNRSFVD